MLRKKLIALTVAAAAAVSALCTAVYGSDSLAAMNTAKSSARSKELSGNLYSAYKSLTEYAALADSLAKEGAVSPAEAEMAAAHRDSLNFDPVIYVENKESSRKIAVGSDGYYSQSATAVKLNVPFGMANVEDFYHTVPKSDKLLTVLVTFEISDESTLRSIPRGSMDSYIIKNLHGMSLIEGNVYLAFCPGVNGMHQTRTLPKSYVDAYRYVAALARRYAPGVGLVYSIGDVSDPGADTVKAYYPGDEWVDVLGVELCHTYKTASPSSSKAAYDRRGDYYDPVYSVKHMADEFRNVCGRDIPLMVTGASFPWIGKAFVDGWSSEMKRFYSLLPLVCPNLEAVFYSNASSAMGICNLRQNLAAMNTYEQCLTMPWYTGSSSSTIENAPLRSGQSARLELYCGGKFDDTFEVWQNGQKVDSESLTFIPGKLTVYMTDPENPAKIEYTLTLGKNWALSAERTKPKEDLNNNGILDFGDVEILSAYIIKPDSTADSSKFDMNGDGKTNMADITELSSMLKPQ